MYHTKIKGSVYNILLGLLILFSFFTFSEQYFPLLNSDMAINILMTPGFTIPGDLYFWGQDRAGSLIPMVAQLLCTTYHFPPILAVSVVHYFFLMAGFFALSTLFKDLSLKLALALIWFFPCWHFLDHLLLLYGIQMSMVALAIYFLNRLTQAFTLITRLLWISLACLSFITAVWVSDLALISLLSFILAVFFSFRKRFGDFNPILKLKEKINIVQLGILLFWLSAGILFILYAKSRALRIDPYNENFFGSPGEIKEVLMIILQSLKEVFLFSSENLPESIYLWVLTLGIPWIFYLTKKKKDPSPKFTQQRWLTFFLINGILTLLVVILSHWVFLNGAGRRYFTVVYISFWLAFLLYLQANGSDRRSLRLTLLFLILLPGSFSSFSKFYFPKKIPPRSEILSEFKSLGNIGLIGEYWNAYLAASIDPGKIKATPHDKDHVRNAYLASEVFRQPKLYLIKDGWLDHFPDTIRQFGHLLRKDGEMFHLGDCYLCSYKHELLFREYGCSAMKVQGIFASDAGTSSGQSVHTGPGFDWSKHFVYGPFITLAPGNIAVVFRLKSSDNLNTSKLAYLDVSADYGKTTLASLTIKPSDFGRVNAFQEFEIPVELKNQYEGIEFRILYLGQPTLTFDKVMIKGK